MSEQAIVPFAFAIYLWGVTAWSYFKGAAAERETMFLLCGVWAASMLMVWVTADNSPLWQFFTIDVFAAWAVWELRRRRWQGIIIALFAAMILVHLAWWVGSFGFFVFETLVYNRMLNTLFALQIGVCGWAILRTSYDVPGWLGSYRVTAWYPRFDTWLHLRCGIEREGAEGTGQ